MLTVNAMTNTDYQMTALAVHGGPVAPSQIFRQTEGLVGALGEDGKAQPMLKEVSGFSDFLADYSESKEDFESEFDTKMDEADSASKSLSKSVEEFRSEERDNAEERATEIVTNFVDRYNDATRFLSERKDVSDQVASLASAFDSTARSIGELSSIGVGYGEDGELRVDTQRLSEKLKEKPEDVEQALGRDGAIGRADKTIRLANYNRERLFPSISKAMGVGRDSAKSMYSGRAKAASDDFGSRGAIFSMYS